MSKRNFKQELQYWTYNDPEYGEDIEHLDYCALISLLTEIVDRLEKLEKWQQRAQASADRVKMSLDKPSTDS